MRHHLLCVTAMLKQQGDIRALKMLILCHKKSFLFSCFSYIRDNFKPRINLSIIALKSGQLVEKRQTLEWYSTQLCLESSNL